MNRSTVATAALAVIAPALALTTPTATAASTEQRAAAPYGVVAKIDKTEVIAGEEIVKITGRVSPKAAGDTVVLQQRKEGRNRWTKSGTARIRLSGRFVLKDDPSTMGVRYYRVVKPAGDGLTVGRSAELRLAVWGWSPLTWRAEGANSGMSLTATPQISTDHYPNSLTTLTPGTAGFVEYTLGRKCRALRATYALTDTSATGATGTARVTVDGVEKARHYLGTGVIVADHEVDVTDAFRVRFDAVASPDPAGSVAIGTPEVLCLDD